MWGLGLSLGICIILAVALHPLICFLINCHLDKKQFLNKQQEMAKQNADLKPSQMSILNSANK